MPFFDFVASYIPRRTRYGKNNAEDREVAEVAKVADNTEQKLYTDKNDEKDADNEDKNDEDVSDDMDKKKIYLHIWTIWTKTTWKRRTKTTMKIRTKRRPRAGNGQRYPLPCSSHFGNLKCAQQGKGHC